MTRFADRLLGFAVGLFVGFLLTMIVVVPSAHAVTVVPGDGSTVVYGDGLTLSYDRWIERSKVITPDVTIEVIEAPCPDGDGTGIGCTDTATDIYIDPAQADPRETFMHELGHVFDAQNWGWGTFRPPSANPHHAAFNAVLAQAGPVDESKPWHAEFFAETYRVCAIKRSLRHSMTLSYPGAVPGMNPIPSVIRRQLCSLLRPQAGA